MAANHFVYRLTLLFILKRIMTSHMVIFIFEFVFDLFIGCTSLKYWPKTCFCAGSELRLTVSGNAAEQQLSGLEGSTTYTVTVTSQLGSLESSPATTSFTTKSSEQPFTSCNTNTFSKYVSKAALTCLFLYYKSKN